MKRCGYCGRESEQTASACSGCGTALPESLALPPIISAQNVPPIIPPAPRLTAGSATLILLAYLGAQVGAGVAVGLVGVVVAVLRGHSPDDAHFTTDLTRTTLAPIALLSLVASGAAVLLTSIRLIREQLRDRSPLGAAWALGSSRELAQGLALGFVVAFVYGGFAFLFGPHAPETKMGPLTTLSMTPGWPQIAWIFSALLFAPPIEELLFRGVVYGGYRRSFGPVWAALASTLIFVLLHITETIYYPAASVGILSLALAALWMRLRSAAIGPAVAVHVGYNSMIATAVLAHTFSHG